MVQRVSVDEDKTIEELPPEKPLQQQAKSRGAESEDEATTLWAKSDLFSVDDLDTQEEEDLFAEKALVGQSEGDFAPEVLELGEEGAGGESAPDTVRMSSEEAKAAMREALATAESYDASASADAPLEQESETATTEGGASGPSPTPSRAAPANAALVQRSRLTCNCRICDRGVTTPRQRRLRGSIHSHFGFRCDSCHNVFCAAHIVRVSSLWESVLKMGRFRCVLCEQGARTSREG